MSDEDPKPADILQFPQQRQPRIPTASPVDDERDLITYTRAEVAEIYNAWYEAIQGLRAYANETAKLARRLLEQPGVEEPDALRSLIKYADGHRATAETIVAGVHAERERLRAPDPAPDGGTNRGA